LLRDINQYHDEETTRIVLQLAPLLFASPASCERHAWEEIDEESAQWGMPTQRMKGHIIHIVPLSAQALEQIARLRHLTGHTKLMFPTTFNAIRCMSDNALNKALRSMGYRHEQTAHGFRTLASTLLSEYVGPRKSSNAS
jgi:integrase